jgi:L-2,4-diaminobutyrate decarboxylase
MRDSPPRRVYSGASPEEVRRDLAPLLDWEDEGLEPGRLEALIRERLVPHLMRYDAPGFQSMFNTILEEGAELGARISLEYNQGVTNWQVSPGGATLEDMCGKALCRLFGFGPGADATFMYAGTYANQEAVYLALHRTAEKLGFDLSRRGLSGFGDLSRLVLLASADAHFSIRQAVRILGLGEDGLILIPVDSNLRMDVRALRRTVAELAPDHTIAGVVATAGTTSTGAVDPMDEIADVCAERGIWLHADGAYGLAYALTPECRPLFAGAGRADSVVWDPHKQSGIPIPNSVLFLRDGADFGRMALHAAYFNRPDNAVPDPGLKSPPSTRMFSALALAASLRRQGLPRFIERLQAPIRAIRGLAETLSACPDIELFHRPDTGILCFRLVPQGIPRAALDALQRFVQGRIMASGERTIALTEIGGKAALRLVAVSPAATTGALLDTVEDARRRAGEFAP